MPTPAELEEFEREVADVQALMIASLVAYWADSVQPDPAVAVDGLREFVLDSLAEYATVAASVAADFYQSVRPPGSPSFTPIPVVRDDLIDTGSLIWSTNPLRTEQFDEALDRVAAVIQKDTYAAVVETIGEATDEDPIGEVRFARWPTNSKPCAWCVLRASRGAVYWSESTAERGDHIKCGCKVTAIFPDEPLPYQRKPYMAQYLAGAEEADDRGRKALLAGMRRANGIR